MTGLVRTSRAMRPTSASASARVSPPSKRQFEILSLPHILQSLITHFLKRTLDGLALRIQNALLQRNVHVSFHGGLYSLYVRQRSGACTAGLDQLSELTIEFRESVLQDFAVTRTFGGFELLQHMLAGQALNLACGAQWRSAAGVSGVLAGLAVETRLCLLLLDRFALPSAGHKKIIPAQVVARTPCCLILGQPVLRTETVIAANAHK